MADKQFKALKDFKYGTRMLRAGDDVVMSAPNARIFTAIGAIAPAGAAPRVQAPAPAPKAADLAEGTAIRGGRVDTGTLVERPAPPAPSKKPARKRAPRAKK